MELIKKDDSGKTDSRKSSKDVEKLSEVCKKTNQYMRVFFIFASVTLLIAILIQILCD